MTHNQIEGHEILISKQMSLTHAAFRFGVNKDKLSMILNLK